MTSNFSCVGVPMNSAEDMQALIDRVADDAEFLEVPGGVYLIWQAGDGLEMWLQCDADDRVIGLNPHFAGATRLRFGLVAGIERPGQTALDGSFYGWVGPPGDDPEQGAYPLVFDCPDAALYAELELPRIVTLQLAAFAHHLTVWPDVAAYERALSGEDDLSSQSLIPAGLLRSHEGDERPPVAYAVVTGHVVRAERRHNPLSGQMYQWAEVATHGGTVDLVAGLELVPEALQVGAVVSGGCWLSGQIVPDDE